MRKELNIKTPFQAIEKWFELKPKLFNQAPDEFINKILNLKQTNIGMITDSHKKFYKKNNYEKNSIVFNRGDYEKPKINYNMVIYHSPDNYWMAFPL